MLSLLLLVDDADGKCNNWELVDQIGDIPPGREGHSLIAVNTNVYLLGGVDSDNANNCMNDLHVLYTGSHKWCKVDMSGDIPLAQSSTYVLTNDGRIIAFGGVLNGKACNNIAIMDIESLVWVCPETTGDKPRSRCDHGSAVLGNKMFIFGGSGGEDLWLNDLTYLDLDIMQWTVVESTANSPCPRDYLSLLSIDTPAVQMLIVYGGFTGLRDDRCLGDSHSISVGSNYMTWEPIMTADNSSPGARYGHTAFIYKNNVYVHGGQNDQMMFNDIWMLEISLPQIIHSPTIPPIRDYTTDTPIPAPRKRQQSPLPKEFVERSFDDLRSEYISQIDALFNTLTEKYKELDEFEARLKSEKEQLDAERQELYDTYDHQQKELEEMRDRHMRDNEEWVESMRRENDEKRKEIAEETARLCKERNDLDKEKMKFAEKSNKLDAIMKQVQGLK
jgi:hypothetical protein